MLLDKLGRLWCQKEPSGGVVHGFGRRFQLHFYDVQELPYTY